MTDYEISEIEAAGQKFDPHFHEAVMIENPMTRKMKLFWQYSRRDTCIKIRFCVLPKSRLSTTTDFGTNIEIKTC